MLELAQECTFNFNGRYGQIWAANMATMPAFLERGR